MRNYFCIVLLILHFTSIGQNCSIQVSTKVCLGNTSLFTLKFDTGYTATSYNWNFGNGATSTQSTPVYQYPVRGTFTPAVSVNFSNSTSCSINGPAIHVIGNPVANFSMITSSPQCFKNNEICLIDASYPGLDNAPLQSRLALFGDGGFDNSAPSSGSNLCYSYNDPLGGNYNLVLEVTDTNNCTDRKEIQNAVTVWAKIPELSFATDNNSQCYQTPVLFTNTSKILPTAINNYLWDFGDGSYATSPWSNFTHVYSKSGMFSARLMIVDNHSCRDTFVLTPAGLNYTIDSSIYLSSKSICYRNNYIHIRSLNNTFSSVYWAIYKVGNPIRMDTIFTLTTDTFLQFNDCGQFQIRMYVIGGNCFSRTDSTVNILGPKAVIEADYDPIINKFQCEINDTVYFRSPQLDHSCFHQNPTIYRLWEFDDPFAPACTTDTKLGLNANLNCRYSKDSFPVKHIYKPGKEQCYFPKLILTDLINGCSDTSTTSLKLTQPDAGWDSTANPIRRGLYYKGNPCNATHFFLDETLPKCGREGAWFMPDSDCVNAKWIPIAGNEFVYYYSTICNPNGLRTIGLIIKNGKDKNGNPCYDTAWYHNIITTLPVFSDFKLERISTGCSPWLVKLSLIDSIQDSLTYVQINDSLFHFSPTDSIIPSQYLTINKAGIRKFEVTLTNSRGCLNTSKQMMTFGFVKDFWPGKEVVCIYDSLILFDNNNYFNINTNFWRDTSRILAGKEQLYWDFGDGNGFSKSGPFPSIKYTKPDNYKIRMVASDSLGCKDTMTFYRKIKVVDLKANIESMQPRYLCAPQLLSFSDKSFIIDSFGIHNKSPYDSITLWTWDFGDNKSASIYNNPIHDFTSNGFFSVKLVVQTASGCIDSAITPVFIDGPKPSFQILVDSIGCSPFKVNFKNTTGYPLVNWIWFFRDQNNTTASTQTDSNVSFTYTKSGIYKIYLLGEDTLFDPISGQIKSCRSVFPDSNVNSQIRQIRVVDPIKITILGPDSICMHQPFQLIAKSNSPIVGFNWLFGDSSILFNKIWPDSFINHTYKLSGNFRTLLYPQTSNNICIDTAIKDITVSEVIADFIIDESQTPLIIFSNNSKNSQRYEWDFGHPRSGSKNFSTQMNPTHSYAGYNGTFRVCLKAFDVLDCIDTICKNTRAEDFRLKIPNVLTPNNDNLNDAFDIDIIGSDYYQLYIYNRWGDLVFYSNQDGIGNDGNNWNGKNKNTESDCTEGVYFFVFIYRMSNTKTIKENRGTITLIRD